MELLLDYVQNSRVSISRLQSEIRDERGEELPRRKVYGVLKEFARAFFEQGLQPRMVALSGLRGVGKTTLMWQTALYVHERAYVEDVFFFSIDDLKRLGARLFDVINVLEKEIFGCALNEMKSRIMILIDEIHEADEWQRDLKILYERGKKIFVLVTGSSALLLRSSSDLASRWTLLKIYPFDFCEFLMARSWLQSPREILYPLEGLSETLRDALFYASDYKEIKTVVREAGESIRSYLGKAENLLEQEISVLADDYIYYHNIARFVSVLNKALIVDRVLLLFDRILWKDIPRLGQELFDTANRLLSRLALSDQVHFQTLSKDFGIRESEVEHVITSLRQAEILNVFLPHAGMRSKTGRLQKAFFMSPSLRMALHMRLYRAKLTADLKARLYEDIVAMYLKKNLPEGLVSFGFGKAKNPDFVIETMDAPVLMEVGTGKSTAAQITNYGACRYGLVINARADEPKFDDNNEILFLPLSWMLLS